MRVITEEVRADTGIVVIIVGRPQTINFTFLAIFSIRVAYPNPAHSRSVMGQGCVTIDWERLLLV